MATIWIPKVHLDNSKNPKRQVKIYPSSHISEFQWQCPNCKNMNLMLKSEISSNHSYSCWNCHYTCTFNINEAPENIRNYLSHR